MSSDVYPRVASGQPRDKQCPMWLWCVGGTLARAAQSIVGSAVMGAAALGTAAAGRGAMTSPAQVVMMSAPLAMQVEQRRPVPTTCWCGVHDDPSCDPVARGAAKAVLFPAAAVVYPLGVGLFACLQGYYCIFGCCMMSHVVRRTAALRSGGANGVSGSHQPRAGSNPDTIDCCESCSWESQAKCWVAADNFNGNCWACELPASKRVLKGHVVEAPCQLCLWGTTT